MVQRGNQRDLSRARYAKAAVLKTEALLYTVLEQWALKKKQIELLERKQKQLSLRLKRLKSNYNKTVYSSYG